MFRCKTAPSMHFSTEIICQKKKHFVAARPFGVNRQFVIVNAYDGQVSPGILFAYNSFVSCYFVLFSPNIIDLWYFWNAYLKLSSPRFVYPATYVKNIQPRLLEAFKFLYRHNSIFLNYTCSVKTFTIIKCMSYRCVKHDTKVKLS